MAAKGKGPDEWQSVIERYIAELPEYHEDGTVTWTPRDKPLHQVQITTCLREAFNIPEPLRPQQSRLARILKSMGYSMHAAKLPSGGRMKVYRHTVRIPRSRLARCPARAVTLAMSGHTHEEIAKLLGITDVQASRAIGHLGVTQAQWWRTEQVNLQRAIGDGHLAPHAQAARLVLEAYNPAVYGKAQTGNVSIRVVVDRSGTLREAYAQSIGGQVVDGEVIPPLLDKPK